MRGEERKRFTIKELYVVNSPLNTTLLGFFVRGKNYPNEHIINLQPNCNINLKT